MASTGSSSWSTTSSSSILASAASRSASSWLVVQAWPTVTAVRGDGGTGGGPATGRWSTPGSSASPPTAAPSSAPTSPRSAGSVTGIGGGATSSSRWSAASTSSRSVVGQKGGSERWRKLAYRALTIRESRM